MTDSSRMSEFLHSLEPEGDELLSELRAYAADNNVPIIRRETESFLRVLMELLRPESILEIGTAIGFSSIVMAKASQASIITIENYEKRIPAAKNNIIRSGMEDRIKLVPEEAGTVLRRLREENSRFDMVFLDAAKGQYIVWLPDILALMKPGSVLVADNVLQEQTVLESRFTVSRRERTTHERMREFLYTIKHHSRLESCILNVGDGISLSVMRTADGVGSDGGSDLPDLSYRPDPKQEKHENKQTGNRRIRDRRV